MEGCIAKYKHKFYYVHSTDISNMKGILKSGYINLGKDIPKKMRRLGGTHPMDHIYSHMYFDDIHATPLFFGPCLILHPSIICDYGGIFRKGWSGPILVDLSGKEETTTIKKALDKIHKYIKEYYGMRRNKKTELPWVMSQEFLFDKKISVKDYVIGLALDFVNDKEYDEIMKIVEKKGYDVTIIRRQFKDKQKKTIKELEELYLSPKLDEILKERGSVISKI